MHGNEETMWRPWRIRWKDKGPMCGQRQIDGTNGETKWYEGSITKTNNARRSANFIDNDVMIVKLNNTGK